MPHSDETFEQRKKWGSGSSICVSGWYVFHIIISYSKYKGPDTGAFLVSFKELIKRVGCDERNKNRTISTITYKVLMILWSRHSSEVGINHKASKCPGQN